MIINVEYYKLKDSKHMNDGHCIEEGQLLLKTPVEEDGFILFETYDKSFIKKIFWAKENEVDFMRKVEEEWSEKRIEEMNNDLLKNLV
jgi:hypothetical protein